MGSAKKHPLWLRITHWLNFPFLSLMVWSGLLIYWANDVYPGFFPEWFYEVFSIGHRLADGMSVHFTVAWLLAFNAAVYLGFVFFSGHWRKLLPDREAFRVLGPTLMHELGLRAKAPPQRQFNAAQRIAYTGAVALGGIEALTGLAIYKPVQIGWLRAAFGGYEAARLIHFAVMVLLVVFFVAHVVQVTRAGWQVFMTMVGNLAVLAAGAVALAGIWVAARHAPMVDELPGAFRRTLEWNGGLWQSLFSPSRLSNASPPPRGRRPRFNGSLGLESPIDSAQWRLSVSEDGGVRGDRPLELTMADVRLLPRTETATEFKCIEGWSDVMSYAGVRFSDFMKALRLGEHSGAPYRYVGFETPDGEYYVSIDIESMLHPQTLLAYEMNGEPLDSADGAPLRLIIPVKYGIKSIKRIGRIFFSDRRPPDYWEERGYDWFAGL